MTRVNDTFVERDEEGVQGRLRLAKVLGAAAQVPAVAGVVDALAQQVQAMQFGVCSAEAAQQQPPRHTLEAQSNALPQGSPGEKVAQEPVLAWQVRQPICAATALQQNPPRQAPEGQVEFKVQGRPVRATIHEAVPNRVIWPVGQHASAPEVLLVPGGQGKHRGCPGLD